ESYNTELLFQLLLLLLWLILIFQNIIVTYFKNSSHLPSLIIMQDLFIKVAICYLEFNYIQFT
ncbi:MAG TPA: hypothetical protein VLA74_11795, partial [Nitrososphaeraceae archaeon]|nr:hypothetical protein [Nitrososphaeraceae archaeon]